MSIILAPRRSLSGQANTSVLASSSDSASSCLITPNSSSKPSTFTKIALKLPMTISLFFGQYIGHAGLMHEPVKALKFQTETLPGADVQGNASVICRASQSAVGCQRGDLFDRYAEMDRPSCCAALDGAAFNRRCFGSATDARARRHSECRNRRQSQGRGSRRNTTLMLFPQ